MESNACIFPTPMELTCVIVIDIIFMKQMRAVKKTQPTLPTLNMIDYDTDDEDDDPPPAAAAGTGPSGVASADIHALIKNAGVNDCEGTDNVNDGGHESVHDESAGDRDMQNNDHTNDHQNGTKQDDEETDNDDDKNME